MKKEFFFLISIIVFYACGQASKKKGDCNTVVADTTVKSERVLPAIDPSDSLKIRYVPEKYKTAPKTRQQQKIWMKKWKTAVKENNQKEAIEALEKAARYNSGEACYKLGEIYKSNDRIKSDSLFYFSAIYGYKPGIEWLNSGEGVFASGTNKSLPQFPGGDNALMRYIHNKAKEAFKSPNGIVEFQGWVVVLLVVEKDGFIRHVKVIRNTTSDMSIEKATINIFKNMPKWEPAVWEGQPIRCFFTCPILIRMGM